MSFCLFGGKSVWFYEKESVFHGRTDEKLMGNTQVKVAPEEQDKINKKYKEDFEVCVKNLEQTLSYSVDLGVIYRKHMNEHRFQNLHPTFPVFLRNVSQKLKRPHIIIGSGLYFVFSALQPPYVETTNV